MGGTMFGPSYALNVNRATAEAWLSRIMNQPVLASGVEQD